eukprot:TRINITY_DN63698_c0_g1_i1.p1 TRINITY_DN63698_c0_g1~~TRINITY_DN63698_c0_g1_i1.p1  ORF type:complete len:785 (-),score=119.35 TRINITY_DN63698_c0_g1_i1:180-2534(-)
MSSFGSRKYDVSHVGGEVFTSIDDASERSSLWGELLKEKERIFLRKELVPEYVTFSVQDTFQISANCVWQPAARHHYGRIRHGRFVTLLHSLDEPLTSSWTWIKLARPLYKKGFSVIMIDLPGLGKSKINMVSNVKKEDWVMHDWHVLCQTLDELRVPCCHFVACGSACNAVLKIMSRSPHSLEKEHFFFQPEVDFNELFGGIQALEPGMTAETRQRIRELQQEELVKQYRHSKVRIWCAVDRDQATLACLDTIDRLAEARKGSMTLTGRMRISNVSKSDLCPAHLGVKLNTSLIFLCRQLQYQIVKFFDEREGPLPADALHEMPDYYRLSTTPRETLPGAKASGGSPSSGGGVLGDPTEWGFVLEGEDEDMGGRVKTASTMGASRRTTMSASGLAGSKLERSSSAVSRRSALKDGASKLASTTGSFSRSSSSLPERPKMNWQELEATSAASGRQWEKSEKLPFTLGVRKTIPGVVEKTDGMIKPWIVEKVSIVDKARRRFGQEAYNKIRWTISNQDKQVVREISGRNQLSMVDTAQDANFLMGTTSDAHKTRIEILGSLRKDHREFVLDRQSSGKDEAKEEEARIFDPAIDVPAHDDEENYVVGAKTKRAALMNRFRARDSEGSDLASGSKSPGGSSGGGGRSRGSTHERNLQIGDDDDPDVVGRQSRKSTFSMALGASASRQVSHRSSAIASRGSLMAQGSRQSSSKGARHTIASAKGLELMDRPSNPGGSEGEKDVMPLPPPARNKRSSTTLSTSSLRSSMSKGSGGGTPAVLEQQSLAEK